MLRGKIEAKGSTFAAAVKWAAKFTASKPVVPVQGGILLEADGSGSLVISAFNDSVSARAVIPVEGDGAGKVVVSGRLLAALADTFPDKPVTITADDGVTLAAGRWDGTLPEMPAEDFPDRDAAPTPIGTVDGDAFAGLISSVATATSDDPDKQIHLQCMGLVFGKQTVRAAGFDGYRACISECGFPDSGLDGPVTATVLARVLRDVANAFAGPDQIVVGWNEQNLSLTSPNRTVIIRQVGEPFPDLAAGFRVQRSETVTFSVADMQMPLKRAGIVRAKDGPIKLVVGDDLVTVVAAADDIKQRGGEEVDAEHAGAEHTLAFNPRYLSDAIGSAPGDRVTLAYDITSPNERPHSVLVTVPGEDAWRHLLMPLKI